MALGWGQAGDRSQAGLGDLGSFIPTSTNLHLPSLGFIPVCDGFCWEFVLCLLMVAEFLVSHRNGPGTGLGPAGLEGSGHQEQQQILPKGRQGLEP